MNRCTHDQSNKALLHNKKRMRYLIMNKNIKFCFGAIVFSLVSSLCSANGYQTWIERFTCGTTSYKVSSFCKAADDPETLNDCKWQRIEITQENGTRKTKLPELNRFSTKAIKSVGGSLENLFLVRQACKKNGEAPLEIFYYSIGGGSAPYGEAWAVYDSKGRLLEEDDPRVEQANDYPFKRMRPVRSIMPE